MLPALAGPASDGLTLTFRAEPPTTSPRARNPASAYPARHVETLPSEGNFDCNTSIQTLESTGYRIFLFNCMHSNAKKYFEKHIITENKQHLPHRIQLKGNIAWCKKSRFYLMKIQNSITASMTIIMYCNCINMDIFTEIFHAENVPLQKKQSLQTETKLMIRDLFHRTVSA
ncbi:hypothetical protein [Megalodesulfovibrio paquesii]